MRRYCCPRHGSSNGEWQALRDIGDYYVFPVSDRWWACVLRSPDGVESRDFSAEAEADAWAGGMTPLDILRRIEEAGVRVRVAGLDLHVSGQIPAPLLAALEEHETAIRELLSRPTAAQVVQPATPIQASLF